MPVLLCACAAPAIAQQPVALPPAGLHAQTPMDRKAELRKDVIRVNSESVGQPPASFKGPAPSRLSAGEREELRQFLRQQQIESIRPKP